jgi:hypothetical protein
MVGRREAWRKEWEKPLLMEWLRNTVGVERGTLASSDILVSVVGMGRVFVAALSTTFCIVTNYSFQCWAFA